MPYPLTSAMVTKLAEFRAGQSLNLKPLEAQPPAPNPLAPMPLTPTGLKPVSEDVLLPLPTTPWMPYGSNPIGPEAGGIYVIDSSSNGNNLVGNGNDNYMVGLWGNDNLYGKGGNDHLDGYGHGTNGNGNVEYDVLTGDFWYSQPNVQGAGDGADVFALGSGSEVYYQGLGHAMVRDFNRLEGDRVQLHDTGNPLDYTIQVSTALNNIGMATPDTRIFYQGDLIGILRDTTNFALNATSVNFVYTAPDNPSP